MSASTSTSLTARKPEDAKQLMDYAIELTKAWSLKKLGYDITIRDGWSVENNRGFAFLNYFDPNFEFPAKSYHVIL